MTVDIKAGKRTVSPFRFDNVGSFLRPQALKNARAAFAEGNLSEAELKKIEDESIVELIEKQKEVGLQVITDGEFRRSWWHLDFMWGLNGVEKRLIEKGYRFNDEETRPETASLTGKISGENHPFVDHFKFVHAFATDGVVARQTIPAPAQFLSELQRAENKKLTEQIYPDQDELLADIAKAYQTVILDLYNEGCRSVQLDDCTWGMCCDTHYWAARQDDANVEGVGELFLHVNNLALQNLPEDLVVTTHVCRGNYHSTWASSGGYDPIAEILFEKENVSAFYLEFDTERAGDFSPLQHVSEDKLVVLGLFSSKTGELENKEEIKARIEEAAKYVDLDRLCISPQCGFASTEEGNILTEEQQWNKLRLIKDVADEIWG
ncbi:methionine synthase II (cobalamin-independent) [Lysinibacillus composti]|uniref:5-methyltetrahydropteroyltriglutamate--homocysteine S-methyltransferase n=1 Tax=Lysinibacillus composti TaxID=720633 RepID=A0A3N9UF07_9BACI|nr:5-methyltetrahydropteroyltriglutamate--homocysteine S-methyltransferase [Lysinibacillus composti]MBM7608465.1 methionine synthase II (cobalamin-independent) [Lysinibacillus composti]RQW74757.1 5-methyltetrahydropteroyltriglutamate--homocysteine S-methyltransferase [Lysinibacillus composti]